MYPDSSLGAFFVALGVACYTHYYKIVQNEYFGYPDVCIICLQLYASKNIRAYFSSFSG